MCLPESGQHRTEAAEKPGVSITCVNGIIKGRGQIVNKTFVKMMDELDWFCCFPGRKEGYCV